MHAPAPYAPPAAAAPAAPAAPAFAFSTVVADIGNRDLSRVDLNAAIATIGGVRYALPEYAPIRDEVARLRDRRRVVMTDARWHATRLVYGRNEDDESIKASLVSAVKEVQDLDDRVVALRKYAFDWHDSKVQAKNRLRAEMQRLPPDGFNTQTAPETNNDAGANPDLRSLITRFKTLRALGERVRDIEVEDTPALLYPKVPTRVLPPVATQHGGGKDGAVVPTDKPLKKNKRYAAVKNVLVSRRWPIRKSRHS